MMPLDPQFWSQIFSDILVAVVTWLPKLLASFVLLLVGWLIARLSQFFLAGLLRRLGFDRFAERAGVAHILTEMGLESSAANLLARVVYWLILLVFLLAAAESVGFLGITDTISSLIAYLPSVLAAALVLLLGSLLARVVGEAVTALANQSGMASGPVWGQAVRYVLIVFAAILALEQLGVATTLLTTVTIALIAATALALALAFGLGNRDLARNIMAGFHAKETFAPGQKLIVRGHAGRLVMIGPVKSVLETTGGQVYLPNIALIDEDVIVAFEEDEAR
jgi:hypothetical protein